MCVLGSGLLRERSHIWKSTFPCQRFPGSGCQPFRLHGTMVHFQCLPGCLRCLCVCLCHLVLIGLCPLCLWRHEGFKFLFITRGAVACYTNQPHLDTPSCKYGTSTPLHLWGSRWPRPCLQLWRSSFAQKPCLLHFCLEIPSAKPEEACNHHQINEVSSPPGYAEVLVALMSWVAALPAENHLAWHSTQHLCIPCFVSSHL